MLYYDVLKNQYCNLYIESSDHGLTCVAFIDDSDYAELATGINERSSAIHKPDKLRQANNELQAYFNGELTQFKVAVDMQGTSFQNSVWQQLCLIPFGTTISYGELAQRLGNANASRAVGSANGKNPVAIIVPCHRVIGADGTLTGYASGLDNKKMLLAVEGIPC